MIFFGHIGISIFLGSLISLSLFAVLIGALLPDVIDKALYLLGFIDTGRYIGHTLFLGILISLIVHIILRKKLLSLSLLFGYWLHLLEDATKFVPWFYPFVSYDFSAYTIGPVFTSFNIASEIVGIFMFIYVVRTNSHFRGYLNKFLNGFKIGIHKNRSE
jgi:membrane-bound metal-dependent hydrolase YbcI (DUF457 family)